MSIRPECWTLHEAEPEKNSVRGRVGEAVYLGEIAAIPVLHRWQSPQNLRIEPRLSARSSDRDLFATAQAEDVVVLRR